MSPLWFLRSTGEFTAILTRTKSSKRRISHFATHEHAIQITRGMKDLIPLNPPHNKMIWGTAALKHATSWQHIDSDGFATAVTNMVGLKYWVMARRRRDRSELGNMSSVTAFGDTIRSTSALGEIYEHEGVLLSPGSVL
jgi:hypothetical protein